jgi:hypothetical protein
MDCKHQPTKNESIRKISAAGSAAEAVANALTAVKAKKTQNTKAELNEQEMRNKDIEFIQKLNQAKIEAVRKVVEILNDRDLIGLVDRDFIRSVQKDVITAANEII